MVDAKFGWPRGGREGELGDALVVGGRSVGKGGKVSLSEGSLFQDDTLPGARLLLFIHHTIYDIS